MAKVTAIHEIGRPGEVIKPGQTFTSTGEELVQLKAAGAIKYDTKDAEDAEVKSANTDDDQPADKPKTATAAKGKGGSNKADKDLV